jgi:AraC-like DNA-binding protein
MNNAQLRKLPVLERFLAALQIAVANFTLCEIRHGWSARFEACATASLHYCMYGSGVLITRHRERVSLSAHSFVLLPPGIGYKIESGKSCATRETNRSCVGDWPWQESVPTVQVGGGNNGISTACGELRLDTTSGSDPFKTLRHRLVAQFDDKSGLRDQFVLLLAESARLGLGSRTLVEALLKQCLILVLRGQIDNEGVDLPWAAGVADRRLASALEAILERSASASSVERLADIAGMSRSAFAAQFMKAFGLSPMALLKIVRLKEAAESLATTNYPVAEVAKMVGFSSRSNFSMAFNALHGLDSSAFRRRLTSVRERLPE